MDVKSTFLHGDFDEDIYMKQPEGYLSKGISELVSKLEKLKLCMASSSLGS